MQFTRIEYYFGLEVVFVSMKSGEINLICIGEWVAEWQVGNATEEDYRRYAVAQLEVFGKAAFGWAYWTLKNVNNYWSLEWMIKNGYIKL